MPGQIPTKATVNHRAPAPHASQEHQVPVPELAKESLCKHRTPAPDLRALPTTRSRGQPPTGWQLRRNVGLAVNAGFWPVVPFRPNLPSTDVSYSAMEFAHEAEWRVERCFCMNTLIGS